MNDDVIFCEAKPNVSECTRWKYDFGLPKIIVEYEL